MDQNEQPGPAAPPPVPPIAHLTEIVATAVSTDETMAMIKFKDAQGKEAILTMPVERLQSLQHVCTVMRRKITRRSMPVSDMSLQPVKSFKIGETNARGITALMLDEFEPTEAVYVMHDQDAMRLAEELERSVLSRMTPEERRQAMLKKSPLILPDKHSLIMPENLRGD